MQYITYVCNNVIILYIMYYNRNNRIYNMYKFNIQNRNSEALKVI